VSTVLCTGPLPTLDLVQPTSENDNRVVAATGHQKRPFTVGAVSRVVDTNTGETVFRIRDERVVDANTGQTVYRIRD
jgi:hypothetical protein